MDTNTRGDDRRSWSGRKRGSTVDLDSGVVDLGDEIDRDRRRLQDDSSPDSTTPCLYSNLLKAAARYHGLGGGDGVTVSVRERGILILPEDPGGDS